MAQKPIPSFAAGELDPALRKRTTLERYNSALSTNRNAIIGKTGRWITRGGRKYYATTKHSDRRVILYALDNTDYLIEWGHEYVRLHDLSLGTYQEVSHALTEDDLDDVHFETSGIYVYVFCAGKTVLKFRANASAQFMILSTDGFYFTSTCQQANAPHSGANGGTGIYVQYIAVAYVNGEPGEPGEIDSVTYQMPDTAADEVNTLGIQIGATYKPTELRIYRRPVGDASAAFSGAYGYIGSVYDFVTTGSAWRAKFTDSGAEADYSQQPHGSNLEHDPNASIADVLVPSLFLSPTGCIYQRRLLLTRNTAKHVVEASRPAFENNFYRDYPIAYDSALTFRVGSGRNADILRMIDSEAGLIAFTSRGIYLNSGLLSPSNLGFNKKGGYVIDETVRPLTVPDGVLFVDKSTNTVRSLLFSDERQSFTGEEISIFANHFFAGKRVRSWDFQGGDAPTVWVVFTDGSCVGLTYLQEQQMKAFGSIDGVLPFEYVATLNNTSGSTAYFVTNNNGVRYIEYTTERFVDDLKDFVGVDCGVTKTGLLSGTVTVTPYVTDEWDGLLTITSTATPFANTAGNGAAGSIFRIFDSDGSEIDVEVDTYVSTSVIRCSLVDLDEYPSDEADDVEIYKTHTEVTGLDHLEGQEVSILCDGYVLASPNNNLENYETVVVSGGSITLPDGRRGAITHVGLPYTCDLETLDVATVEQRPVSVESMVGAKLEVSVHQSRGLYVGQRFPKNDKLKDDFYRMEDLEQYYLDDVETGDQEDEGIIGNRPLPLQTRDAELTIEADWKSRGRICLRQVDPLPSEVLAINLDLHDLQRG